MTDLQNLIEAIEDVDHAEVVWQNVAYEEDGLIEFEIEGAIIEPGHPQFDSHDE